MIKKLRAYFGKRKDVALAYLFGSSVSGQTGPLSDIDVGVFLDKSAMKRGNEAELEIIGDLTDLLGGKVDIAVMNGAPPLIKYNIIRSGILVHGKDSERARIEYGIMREYLDTAYLREKHGKRVLQEISGSGLA